MTPPLPPPVRAALIATKQLAYEQIEVGQALLAWAPYKNRWSYLRKAHGTLVYQACALVHEYVQVRATFPTSDKRRAGNLADVRAMIKAVLALMDGEVKPPPSLSRTPSDRFAATSPANAGEDRRVLDFQRRAAGERDEDCWLIRK